MFEGSKLGKGREHSYSLLCPYAAQLCFLSLTVTKVDRGGTKAQTPVTDLLHQETLCDEAVPSFPGIRVQSNNNNNKKLMCFAVGHSKRAQTFPKHLIPL